MLNKIEVEDMTYLTDQFAAPKVSEGEPHASQKAGKPIHMKLLFAVPHPAIKDSEETPGLLDTPEMLYVKDEPMRFVAVNVPKGTPIYRVRNLVRYVEGELRGIFGECKRVNFVFIKDEDSDTWKHSFDLPMYGVTYV